MQGTMIHFHDTLMGVYFVLRNLLSSCRKAWSLASKSVFCIDLRYCSTNHFLGGS